MYFCHILYFLSFCPKCRLFIIEQIFVIYSRNKAFYRKFHKIGNVYLDIAKSFRFIVFVSCFYIKDIFIIFGLYVSKSLYFFHTYLLPILCFSFAVLWTVCPCFMFRMKPLFSKSWVISFPSSNRN